MKLIIEVPDYVQKMIEGNWVPINLGFSNGQRETVVHLAPTPASPPPPENDGIPWRPVALTALACFGFYISLPAGLLVCVTLALLLL